MNATQSIYEEYDSEYFLDNVMHDDTYNNSQTMNENCLIWYDSQNLAKLTASIATFPEEWDLEYSEVCSNEQDHNEKFTKRISQNNNFLTISKNSFDDKSEPKNSIKSSESPDHLDTSQEIFFNSIENKFNDRISAHDNNSLARQVNYSKHKEFDDSFMNIERAESNREKSFSSYNNNFFSNSKKDKKQKAYEQSSFLNAYTDHNNSNLKSINDCFLNEKWKTSNLISHDRLNNDETINLQNNANNLIWSGGNTNIIGSSEIDVFDSSQISVNNFFHTNDWLKHQNQSFHNVKNKENTKLEEKNVAKSQKKKRKQLNSPEATLNRFTLPDENGKRRIRKDIISIAESLPTLPGLYFDKKQKGFRVRYQNVYVGWVALSRFQSIEEAYCSARSIWENARENAEKYQTPHAAIIASLPLKKSAGKNRGGRPRTVTQLPIFNLDCQDDMHYIYNKNPASNRLNSDKNNHIKFPDSQIEQKYEYAKINSIVSNNNHKIELFLPKTPSTNGTNVALEVDSNPNWVDFNHVWNGSWNTKNFFSSMK